MPTVSIGLPVYNGGRLLPETLDSILSQEYIDFELVISDNASSDETPLICERFSRMDRRVKYFRNDRNLGAAWNYNRVFELSQGAFFKWAAHDDLLDKGFLARCVESLLSSPEAALAYPRTRLIGKQGENIEMEYDKLDLGSSDVVSRFSDTLSPMKLSHNPVFGLIRRDILAKTRLIENFLASDRCLTAELCLYGPFIEIPEKLFIRRKHEGNIGTCKKYLNFYDPALATRTIYVMPEWRVFFEHLVSVRLSQLGFFTKTRLVLAVFRWAFSHHKKFYYDFKEGIRQLTMGIGLPPVSRRIDPPRTSGEDSAGRMSLRERDGHRATLP